MIEKMEEQLTLEQKQTKYYEKGSMVASDPRKLIKFEGYDLGKVKWRFLKFSVLQLPAELN